MTAEPRTNEEEKDMSRPTITVEEARDGEWITPPVSYVNPIRRFCAMTGRPIARRYWRVAVGGVELVFADPKEALRYTTYPTSSDTKQQP